MKQFFCLQTNFLRLLTLFIGLYATSQGNFCLAADENSPKPNSSAKITDDLEQKTILSPSASEKTTSTQAHTKHKSLTLTNPWIALTLVLALILIAAWLLRNLSSSGNRLFGSLPILQVLGRTHLSSKHTLALIKLDNKLLLIGITDHQISPLLTFENEDEISRILTHIEQNRPAGITSGFRNLFSRENNEFESEKNSGNSNFFHTTNISDKSSDKNAENSVFQLKNELNSLLIKIQKMKSNGS
jgi:flagellar protein FliO/FliZ